ncbi:MAG: outer membrane protein transport protein [Sandaracinaceae bacterium]|nr:outer membrane protein transport protein [Sandaracinaceae bacterium]
MSRAHLTSAHAALLLAGLLVAGLPGRAHATPTEQIGFGTRGPGMGNAMVAGQDALGAPIYNPAAGVHGTGEYEFGLGYTYSHLSIDVNDRDPNTLPVRGFWFAGAVPFDIGSAHLSFGLGAYVPDQFLLRAHAVPGTEQRLVMWDNGPHRLVVNATLAWRIADWLSIGVGVSILGSVRGNQVDFTLDADPAGTRAESTLSIDFPILAAPIVGVIVTPIPALRLGARFSDELGLDVVLNVQANVRVPGTPVDGVVDFQFSGPSGFTPRELVLGGSGDLGRFTFSAELAWQQWSRVNQLTAQVQVDVDLGAPVPTSSFVEPHPNLRNTWTPRLGVEYRLPLASERELQLRVGYWFSQTPVPIQTGITNYADANRHVGTLGGTYSFDIAETRVSLEGAFQLQYMQNRESLKDDPTTSGGDLTVGGPIYVFSLGARVSL